MAKKIKSIALMCLIVYIASIIVFSLIEVLVFRQSKIEWIRLVIILGTSIVLGLILYMIFYFNILRQSLQIIVVYTLISLTIFINGAMLNWFELSNYHFIIGAILVVLLGGTLLIAYIKMRTSSENKLLNKNLIKFKERDK